MLSDVRNRIAETKLGEVQGGTLERLGEVSRQGRWIWKYHRELDSIPPQPASSSNIPAGEAVYQPRVWRRVTEVGGHIGGVRCLDTS